MPSDTAGGLTLEAESTSRPGSLEFSGSISLSDIEIFLPDNISIPTDVILDEMGVPNEVRDVISGQLPNSISVPVSSDNISGVPNQMSIQIPEVVIESEILDRVSLPDISGLIPNVGSLSDIIPNSVTIPLSEQQVLAFTVGQVRARPTGGVNQLETGISPSNISSVTGLPTNVLRNQIDIQNIPTGGFSEFNEFSETIGFLQIPSSFTLGPREFEPAPVPTEVFNQLEPITFTVEAVPSREFRMLFPATRRFTGRIPQFPSVEVEVQPSVFAREVDTDFFGDIPCVDRSEAHAAIAENISGAEEILDQNLENGELPELSQLESVRNEVRSEIGGNITDISPSDLSVDDFDFSVSGLISEVERIEVPSTSIADNIRFDLGGADRRLAGIDDDCVEQFRNMLEEQRGRLDTFITQLTEARDIKDNLLNFLNNLPDVSLPCVEEFSEIDQSIGGVESTLTGQAGAIEDSLNELRNIESNIQGASGVQDSLSNISVNNLDPNQVRSSITDAVSGVNSIGGLIDRVDDVDVAPDTSVDAIRRNLNSSNRQIELTDLPPECAEEFTSRTSELDGRLEEFSSQVEEAQQLKEEIIGFLESLPTTGSCSEQYPQVDQAITEAEEQISEQLQVNDDQVLDQLQSIKREILNSLEQQLQSEEFRQQYSGSEIEAMRTAVEDFQIAGIPDSIGITDISVSSSTIRSAREINTQLSPTPSQLSSNLESISLSQVGAACTPEFRERIRQQESRINQLRSNLRLARQIMSNLRSLLEPQAVDCAEEVPNALRNRVSNFETDVEQFINRDPTRRTEDRKSNLVSEGQSILEEVNNIDIPDECRTGLVDRVRNSLQNATNAEIAIDCAREVPNRVRNRVSGFETDVDDFSGRSRRARTQDRKNNLLSEGRSILEELNNIDVPEECRTNLVDRVQQSISQLENVRSRVPGCSDRFPDIASRVSSLENEVVNLSRPVSPQQVQSLMSDAQSISSDIEQNVPSDSNCVNRFTRRIDGVLNRLEQLSATEEVRVAAGEVDERAEQRRQQVQQLRDRFEQLRN